MAKTIALPLVPFLALALIFIFEGTVECAHPVHVFLDVRGSKAIQPDAAMTVEQIGSTTVFRPKQFQNKASEFDQKLKPSSANVGPTKVKGFKSIAEFVQVMLGFH